MSLQALAAVADFGRGEVVVVVEADRDAAFGELAQIAEAVQAPVAMHQIAAKELA